MTLINEVRLENYEVRSVNGQMQNEIKLNFIELSPKKVLYVYHRI